VSFYTDENFAPRSIQILANMKARVTTAQDQGLKRHPDENHAAFALKNGLFLLTCDRDYLDERRFPLIHCPAIAVFSFGSGTTDEIERSFVCLQRATSMPQFFDRWTKIDATPNSWIEYARHLDGTTSRSNFEYITTNFRNGSDKSQEPVMPNVAAIVSVSWGNEVIVSIRLNPRNWARVRRGKPLNIRGKGYCYEAEFFRDYWSFGGGLEGSLTVSYGEDGGVGFEGRLVDARIQEEVVSPPKQELNRTKKAPRRAAKRQRS
jgi:predicted nuclease of predicted toxin-antitoxin system